MQGTCFVTLKDNKDNFRSNPTRRLINPSKSELGKVSKQLLEKTLTLLTNYNLISVNIDVVLKSFNNITDKSNCSLIQFDIKEFNPSITGDILHQTLEFAKQHTNIDKNDLRIINHCRKSSLFSDNNTWKKKSTDSCFDVTMGSLDGVEEICELLGLYWKTRKGTSKIKLWIIPRGWISLLKKF